jgi:hypothetical protein
MVGSRDRVRDETRDALKAFEAAGLRVKLRTWHGVGHRYPPRIDRELTRALQFVCGF